MSNNPSAPYGYYGGVAPNDVYFPPASPEFTPQPRSIRFTKQQQQFLEQLKALSSFHQFLSANAEHILLRTLSGVSGSQKTFVINNIALSSAPIVYSSSLSSINIHLLPTPTPTVTNWIGMPPTPVATSTPSPTPTSTL